MWTCPGLLFDRALFRLVGSAVIVYLPPLADAAEAPAGAFLAPAGVVPGRRPTPNSRASSGVMSPYCHMLACGAQNTRGSGQLSPGTTSRHPGCHERTCASLATLCASFRAVIW